MVLPSLAIISSSAISTAMINSYAILVIFYKRLIIFQLFFTARKEHATRHCTGFVCNWTLYLCISLWFALWVDRVNFLGLCSTLSILLAHTQNSRNLYFNTHTLHYRPVIYCWTQMAIHFRTRSYSHEVQQQQRCPSCSIEAILLLAMARHRTEPATNFHSSAGLTINYSQIVLWPLTAERLHLLRLQSVDGCARKLNRERQLYCAVCQRMSGRELNWMMRLRSRETVAGLRPVLITVGRLFVVRTHGYHPTEPTKFRRCGLKSTT